MENTPTTTSQGLDPVVQKKRQAWADMGQLVHITELSIQQTALQLITKLTPPTTIDEIPGAEATLKDVNTELKLLVEKRKERTSVLDTISARLMNPEKTIIIELEKFKSALLDLKRKQEAENQKKQKAENEIATARIFITEWITYKNAEFKQKISDNVLKCYNYALGEGNIPVDGIAAFISGEKAKAKAEWFTATLEQCKATIGYVRSVYDQQDQIDGIALTLINSLKPASDFIAEYHAALDKQFEFYNVAVNNKEAAKKQAEEAAANEAAKLAEQTANETTAAILENIATAHSPSIEPQTKALKKVWVLDMPDDETTALKIMSAFIANIVLTREKIRVKSYRKLTIDQMAAALCAVKNDDENFKVNVLNFKQDDKL